MFCRVFSSVWSPTGRGSGTVLSSRWGRKAWPLIQDTRGTCPAVSLLWGQRGDAQRLRLVVWDSKMRRRQRRSLVTRKDSSREDGRGSRGRVSWSPDWTWTCTSGVRRGHLYLMTGGGACVGPMWTWGLSQSERPTLALSHLRTNPPCEGAGLSVSPTFKWGVEPMRAHPPQTCQSTLMLLNSWPPLPSYVPPRPILLL